MEHPFADILRAIADGKTIQYVSPHGGALSYYDEDAVLQEIARGTVSRVDLRIKPDTVKIGEREVNAPMRVAPEVGAIYWMPDVTCQPVSDGTYEWRGDDFDRSRLARGMCFATRDDAKAALVAIVELFQP